MVNKLVLVALLGMVAAVAIAEQRKVQITPVVQRMLNTFPKPEVPEGYVSTNPHTIGYKFRTRVDHFDPQNRATFEFEYYSNDEYYERGGPIFIFVGGDWPLEQYYIERGHFHDIAQRTNAWMFTNEHRYYGHSSPVSDYSTENLRYLTVEQAMVDLAEWIFHLRNNVVRDTNAKVILLGTGYAGAIATWARQRYPHLVDGVWASSGKIEARFNFKEYAEEIGELLRDLGNDECYSRIWRAFRTAENLMDAGRTETVTEMFNTCEPVDEENMLDVETFFFNVKAALQDAVLRGQNVEATEALCEALEESTEETDIQVIAQWLQEFYFFLDCMPFDFEAHTDAFRLTEIGYPENANLGLRQRVYQFCTEFGWFLTADSADQPFGYRVTMYFFLNFCRSVFGEWLSSEVVADGVHLTNMHFGGQNPRISNVLFTNGALDPQRDISITEYLQPRSNAIVIPGYFASPDLNAISGYNSPELIEAKHKVQQYIESWLYEPVTPYERR
ncbi:putative serine protease K12H4.7 [Culex quinquefasciatus]|uniref:putative serine protease K12H4.7 n=1 Tax=Culex quinquefasciatus TaxID=7176 RepID=UPI0018E3F94B|nr:putative serine protease K12H4.7 [Culex quinquefasciatus]